MTYGNSLNSLNSQKLFGRIAPATLDVRRWTKNRAVDANCLICDESWQDVIMTDLSRALLTLP